MKSAIEQSGYSSVVERLTDHHEVSGSNPDVRLVNQDARFTASMVIL